MRACTCPRGTAGGGSPPQSQTAPARVSDLAATPDAFADAANHVSGELESNAGTDRVRSPRMSSDAGGRWFCAGSGGLDSEEHRPDLAGCGSRRGDCSVRRQLLVVRHAKSSWDDTSLADHDRPLAPRGTRALARLRDHLDRSEHQPEIVLCSSSRRTIETLDGIRAAIPEHAQVVLAEELYVATADSLLALLHGVDEGAAEVDDLYMPRPPRS